VRDEATKKWKEKRKEQRFNEKDLLTKGSENQLV
jgi:hypothetical protein